MTRRFALSRSRGHVIEWDVDDRKWYYTDGQPFDDTRICVECNIPHTPKGTDACLGMKPGVWSMCCTHGGRQLSIYMMNPLIRYRLLTAGEK